MAVQVARKVVGGIGRSTVGGGTDVSVPSACESSGEGQLLFCKRTSNNRLSAVVGSPVLTAGWYIDPSGRHERRFWSGSAWTPRVEDAGISSVEEIVNRVRHSALTGSEARSAA